MSPATGLESLAGNVSWLLERDHRRVLLPIDSVGLQALLEMGNVVRDVVVGVAVGRDLEGGLGDPLDLDRGRARVQPQAVREEVDVPLRRRLEFVVGALEADWHEEKPEQAVLVDVSVSVVVDAVADVAGLLPDGEGGLGRRLVRHPRARGGRGGRQLSLIGSPTAAAAFREEVGVAVSKRNACRAPVSPG